MITLIGLGVKQNDLSLSAKLALDRAKRIMARTSQGEAYTSLAEYNVVYLDGVFMRSRNFDTLNKNLAEEVIKASKEVDVIYCVDGAVSEDEACKIILNKKKDALVLEGVSKISTVKNAARLRSSAVCALSAYEVEKLKSCAAAVIYDIDDFYASTKVKEILTNLFGEETDCVFVRGDRAKKIKIYEIDRQSPYGADCAVAVEEGEYLKKDRYDFADLEQLIRMLRAPGGCPWDRAQTNESIRKNMIEEAYELVDAINRGDDDGIEEECGDVLLQAAFHAVMKEEQGAFNGADAITRVVKKLIFRHSHIFGKDKATDADSALSVWDKNKAEEKKQTTFGEQVLAVPTNFPACMRAQKVGKRAAKSGMDFLSSVSASEKLEEEVRELLNALVADDKDAVYEEAGDVLFAAVNVCRLAGVDCEEALSASTDKFVKRFVECERQIIADGKDITQLDGLELDWYWLKAKNALKGN
ncbi:MAG: nucleoside triphosphate pyrophosphohydrolase [Candidatus Coproplasma sp.]